MCLHCVLFRERDLKSSYGELTPPASATISLNRRDKERKVLLEQESKAQVKDPLNMVVIGHVDAGKSTLMGHLLFQLGRLFVVRGAVDGLA